MQEETHTQCRLVKADDNSTLTQISWIPTKFAILERRLELGSGDRRSDLTWDDGWIVKGIGGTQPTKMALARERDYLKHRKACDI